MTSYGLLRVRVASANLIVNPSGGLFARNDYYVRISNQDEPSSVVTTKTKGPTSTPSFDATLTLPPGYFKTRTILVEIMDKLRFGADVPIAHTLIDLKKSAFQAGKKGTLFEWYGLEHAASETNGGEISLSFAFEALPEPVSNETVVILKPWYLTAEGLYIGVKDTWEWLEENPKSKRIAAKANNFILSIIEKKGGSKSGVDGIITDKLSSFDKVVDEIIPTAADYVPFTSIKVKVEPTVLPTKVLFAGKPEEDPESSPETSKPVPETKTKIKNKKRVGKKTVAERVTGYPSLLGVSRRVPATR